MNKKLNISVQLLLLGIISFIFTACVNDNEPDGGNISLNDKVPQFSVVMNNGVTVETQDLIGKIGLIMFFNTNCPDCQKELPVVQELWQLYKDNNDVMILPIAREEGEDEITEYWIDNNLTMPFSPQKNRELYSLFAKSVIPRIYISNPEGIVVFMSGDDDLPSLDLLIDTIEAHF